jgi:hypothetical protein
MMPRYFFNFDGDRSAGADLVGRNLPNDEAAKAEAAKLAADMNVTHAIEGEWPAFQWIDVVDEEQRPVARLPISDAVPNPNRFG